MGDVIRLHPTTDIPMMLREMADRIERGEEGEIEKIFGIAVTESDAMVFYGWGGDFTNREIMGLLSMAEHAWVHEQGRQ